MKPVARTLLAAAASVAAGLATILVAAPPAIATTGPDLQGTASFDHATYHVGDPFAFTITLTNHGSDAAHNVHVTGSDATAAHFTTEPTFGFDLAGGESKPLVFEGTVGDEGLSVGFVAFALSIAGDEGDPNPDQHIIRAAARVLGGVSTVTGRVFDSAGGDSTSAPGVAGTVVLLTNALDATVTATGTSDSTGAFTITGVPAGPYNLATTLPADWKLTADAPTGLLANAPEAESLDIPLVRNPATTTTTTTTTTTSAAAAAALPTTGSPVRLIVGVGASALIAGVVLIGLARRRRTTG
jgi:LPXTG-motif cell wall-anchored protein